MDSTVQISNATTLLPRLDVQVLGDFSVAIDGVGLPLSRWSAIRAKHLVQLLCLQPHQRLSRDVIIDAFWPQLDPEAGAANLRKALYHARQALGRHDAVSAQGNELVLWPCGVVRLDMDVFEHAAQSALKQRDAIACATASDLYTGDLLPGSRYESWSEPVRERLQSMQVDLLCAAKLWARLAHFQPTDEVAHQALMREALSAGNRAQALYWYAHLREALQQDLGVTPDGETQALYEQCISGLPPHGPVFVGRAAELAQLMGALQRPILERPGAIALIGPAGIGKSALCREIAGQVRHHGWLVVPVQAVASGQSYSLMTAVVERLILVSKDGLERVGAPARAVLAQLTSMAEPAQPLLGPLGRHQVVGAVRRLMLAVACSAPLLLHLDDVHLAADSDLDVLAQLTMAGPPVCLLMTLRSPTDGSFLAQSVGRLQRVGVLLRLDVAPMGEQDLGRLIESVAEPAVEAGWLHQIISNVEGNPFAAIELARCAKPGTPRQLPTSTMDAIADRLCDVDESVQSYLRWLAIAGDEIEALLLEPLARLAQVPAFTAINAALTAGVLCVVDGRYRFRHELVRQTLIAKSPPHQRLRMHRAVAATLVELGALPSAIAGHFLSGGQPREAIPYLIAGARDALRLAAFADVLNMLDPLLAKVPNHPEALRLRAEALDAQGDPAALFAYRLAASVASDEDNHNLRAKAALAQVKLGDPKGALTALEGVHPTSVEGRLCEALAWSGAAALGAVDPAIGTVKSAAARRLALESGDTTSLVIASWAQAAAAHARGELHRSVWADLHDTSQAPHLALRVFDGHLCITQRFLYGARPYADVIAFADSIASEAKRLGAARGHAFGTTLRGEAELLSGDLVAAKGHLREGARLHRDICGPVGEALALQRLAELAMHEGHHDEARDLLDDALDIARQTDIGFHLLDRIYGARIHLHANDPDAAFNMLEDASASVRGPLETCPGCRITFAVPAAIAAARAGKLELAQKHEEQCAYLANVVMRLPAWYAAHQEVLGHLHAARHMTGEAASRFMAAAQRFREAGQPLDAARCEQLVRTFPSPV